MLAVAETISKVATHASSFIGIACIAASLLSNSWTVSDVVYTGLTLRCVNYPGISDCRTIEGMQIFSELFFIKQKTMTLFCVSNQPSADVYRRNTIL